jgi:hypothetical protein
MQSPCTAQPGSFVSGLSFYLEKCEASNFESLESAGVARASSLERPLPCCRHVETVIQIISWFLPQQDYWFSTHTFGNAPGQTRISTMSAKVSNGIKHWVLRILNVITAIVSDNTYTHFQGLDTRSFS